MTTKISFGKVSYSGNTKRNRVFLKLRLNYKDDDPKKPCFSVCGEVWQSNGDDIEMGGQCVDTIWELFKNEIQKPELYKEIMDLWKKYHLNDMKAGTPAQEAAVEEYLKTNNYDYKEVCNHLYTIGLLRDPQFLDYRYGTDWLYSPIPDEDLTRIKQIMEAV